MDRRMAVNEVSSRASSTIKSSSSTGMKCSSPALATLLHSPHVGSSSPSSRPPPGWSMALFGGCSLSLFLSSLSTRILPHRFIQYLRPTYHLEGTYAAIHAPAIPAMFESLVLHPPSARLVKGRRAICGSEGKKKLKQSYVGYSLMKQDCTSQFDAQT